MLMQRKIMEDNGNPRLPIETEIATRGSRAALDRESCCCHDIPDSFSQEAAAQAGQEYLTVDWAHDAG